MCEKANRQKVVASKHLACPCSNLEQSSIRSVQEFICEMQFFRYACWTISLLPVESFLDLCNDDLALPANNDDTDDDVVGIHFNVVDDNSSSPTGVSDLPVSWRRVP